jgi:hypothetical protein
MLAMPMLYWTLCISNYRSPDEVHDLAISLSRNREKHRDWALYVRELLIELDTAQDEHTLIRMLESMPFVESLKLNQVWTPGILAACSRGCAASLKTLIITDAWLENYRSIGSLFSLATIHIATGETTPVLDDVDGWHLPALTSITWEDLDSLNVPVDHIQVIWFLSQCCFPQLQTATLLIDVSHDDGPTHIRRFLDAHPSIDTITLSLPPSIYEAIIPSVRTRRLDLTRCGDIRPSLLDYLSPAVKRLDLPVFFESPAFTLERQLTLITDTLEELTVQPRSLVDVHLATGQRWDEDFDDPNGIDREQDAPLEVHCAANAHPNRNPEISRIHDVALRLRQRGITVYDEKGTAFGGDGPATDRQTLGEGKIG